ncbi:MAG: Rieske 2Fe-2S domain-containing protein [Gammaproteobacteria bacterium]|nr:Rieske 2Fe-2S domain-containing protein [Gammaproteobacteria bacterium]
MLSRNDNEMLTQTGPGTPMGDYFRRFWQPVALGHELADRDGPPVRVNILGEALVAFRDSDGRVGLIDARCPHRGANLFYGRNEECGLRCVYHGWKFDVDGKAVDLPNVAPGANYHGEMRTTAYPTREFGGIVWAYLGPQNPSLPEVSQLEFGTLPSAQRYVSKKLQECNWAQTIEGGLDTSHFSFLHMPAPSVPSNENPDAPADAQRLRWIRNDPMPQFSILEHDVGFVIGGARAADDLGTYWRITQYMLPAHGTGPSTMPGETYFGYTLVPIDDVSCWMYTYAWNPTREIGAEERAKLDKGHGIVSEVDEHYVPLRNKANDYLLDREQQRNVSFSGVRGLAEQDAMIQESQGLIVDRTRENLTATDAAVVRFRKTVLEAAKALREGQEPVAPWSHEAYRNRPGSWIAADGTSFEDVMVERFGDRLGRVDG